MKLFGQEAEKKLHELALEVDGPNGLYARGADLALDGGRWADRYLRSRASTIGGGTSDVQRSVIAERVLGLPGD